MPRLANLPAQLDRLEREFGPPATLPPRSALDWILWENAGYLVDDERRRKAYRALSKSTRLEPAGILALSREQLLEIAALGGMLREQRVAKLIDIAETVRDEFGGDLESVLSLPAARARRALRAFPGIGAPGADKILLFTGTLAVPALESNGLRSLVRLGYAREGKNYTTTYRSGIEALTPHVGRGSAWLQRAFDLLRRHGQQLCKNTEPLCDACPLVAACPSAE